MTLRLIQRYCDKDRILSQNAVGYADIAAGKPMTTREPWPGPAGWRDTSCPALRHRHLDAAPSRLSRQLAEALDDIECLRGTELRQIDLTELDEQRIRQGREEAAGEGAAGLDLAADRAFGQARVGAVLLLEEGQDLACAVEYRGGHAGELGHVNAVALIGAAGDDAVQEDDLALALTDGHIGVEQPRLGLLQLHKLVVMRGEEGPATDRVVDVLGDRPGQRDAVERAGATTDLVEDDKAAWRGVVQDVGRLGHLDHEGALTAAQLVGRSNAGEEAVNHTDPGALRGDEAADLGQDGDQRDLADIRTLAGHVRAGDQDDRAVVGTEASVVGHEVAGGQERVENRMAAALDVEDRLIGQLGPAVAVACGELSQRGQDVELGQHRAGLDQPGSIGRDPVAQRREQLVLQGACPLVGAPDLVLKLLELGREIPLGVLDRLLANVVRGNLHALRLGVGDLDVIAKDLVEANLETRNAGAADLLGLVPGNPALAILRDRPQTVELGVVTRSDQASLLDDQRRILDQGGLDGRPDLGA